MAYKSKESKPASKPPIEKIRIGLLQANIWEQHSDNGTFYSVSFVRRYKDAHDEWKSTHGYNAADLLTLAKLADQAHSRILEIQSAAK
jgi:hypothetical protein